MSPRHATCRPSAASLTIGLRTCFDLRSVGSNARAVTTSPARIKLHETLVPHGGKRKHNAVKVGAAVTHLRYRPNTLTKATNPWALHSPASLATWRPHRHPRGPPWTRVASCYVSAPCAPPAPHAGHPWLCHVALVTRCLHVVVPRATSVRHLAPLATSSPAGKKVYINMITCMEMKSFMP